MIRILLLVSGVLFWETTLKSQVTIAQQDFETSPASPVWSISAGAGNISAVTGASFTPANQNIRNGSRSWQVSNGSTGVTLELGSVSVSGYTGVQVIVRISSTSVTSGNGADAGDYVRLFTSLNGAAFASNSAANADINVAGNSNARWGYNNAQNATTTAGTNLQVAGSPGTNAGTIYSTLIVNIPNGTNTVALRIIALNNDANESWNVDDIQLTGTLAATPDIVLSSPNPAVAAGSPVQGSVNQPVYRFDLAVSTASATLNGVTVTTGGTYTAADLVNLKCWYSADNTFNAGSDVLLSTKTSGLGAGAQVFPSFTSQAISNGSTGYIFITADLACGAGVGNTLSVSAITTADISFVSGNKSGTADAGGTQTFAAGSPANAGSPAATNGTAQSSVSWTNPPGCFDEILILAAAGSANTGTPTGDGSAYTASLSFGSGTAMGNGFVVYKGSASPQVITGLTNGTTYYFKLFTRLGSNWSTGVEVSATPAAPVINTYTWSGGNGSWLTAANWSPVRTSPANTDILVFNTGTSVTVSGVPSETFGKLVVSDNTTVNLQAGAASNVLTVGGGTGTDLDVQTGSSLNIDGTNALSLLLGAGSTGIITGSMTFSNANHRLDAADANAITFSSPAVFTQGAACTGNVFTNAGTANAVIFGSGSTFVQNAGSNPFGLTAPASKVVFQPGSLFRMQFNAALSLSGRTYGNLEINAPTFSQNQTGATALTVGDLIITDGTINLNLTGGVIIRGNISVATGETLTFSPGSAATITFNGVAPQQISSSGVLTFGNNASININNAAGVTLNTSLTLGSAATLTLTSGILTLGNNNLTVNTLSGGSSSSYIRTNGTGALTINAVGAGPVSFPVGNSRYNPLLIENGSGHNWSARVIDGLTADPGFNTDKAVLVTWDITPSVNPPAGGADITFQFDEATQTGAGFSTAVNVQGWRRPGDIYWTPAGTPAVVNTSVPNAATVKLTGLTSFSKYALSNIDGPLPVTLLRFSGYREAGVTRLSWATATEVNNRGFDIQRSADGRQFETIGFVASAATGGNSSSPLEYIFSDTAPASASAYYRLRQNDLDGRYEYSNVILLRGVTGASTRLLSLFPNPARSTVQLQVESNRQANVIMRLFNPTGQVLAESRVALEKGTNTIPFRLPSVPAGMYLLQLLDNENVVQRTLRIIKND